MTKRIIWGGVYAGVLIAVFGFRSFGSELLGLFLILLLNEMATIQKMESRFPLLSIATLGLIGASFFDWGTSQDLVVSTILISILVAFTLLKAEQPANEIRKALFALAYIWLPLGYAIQQASQKPQLILLIFVMIWASDSAAYLFGRAFGKRALAPKLSPKKTIEGFIGGIFGTILVGIITNVYWELVPMNLAISMALSVSICAPFGDLVASAIKREGGVKDSGVFLPGHGGALDRLDSFITSAPVALLIYQYLS